MKRRTTNGTFNQRSVCCILWIWLRRNAVSNDGTDMDVLGYVQKRLKKIKKEVDIALYICYIKYIGQTNKEGKLCKMKSRN
jgi:hypothetical protein